MYLQRNLLVLSTLKFAGIEKIIFETPTYFGTRLQAELLGLSVVRVPCYYEGGFDAGLATFRAEILRNHPCALWITQPRFGIGTNQPITRLRELANLLGPKDAFVIDEAAEQTFPSISASLGPVDCAVIRARGLLKGIGLNGLRMSVVLHPPQWRERFTDILEVVGASLDRFSLTNAVEIARQPNLFRSMLAHANAQVLRGRKKIEIMSLGSWAEPTPLENSYIGSILLNLSNLPGSYLEKRRALLSYCRDRRMPVILGASIGFAFDHNREAVRINYFTPDNNIESSVRILLEAHRVLIQSLAGPRHQES